MMIKEKGMITRNGKGNKMAKKRKGVNDEARKSENDAGI
jgi:hypothetical protein